MKIEGYEEVKFEELIELPAEKQLKIYNYMTEKHHYFKKVQKFPICFEDEFYKIEVYENRIEIIDLDNPPDYWFRYDMSFPLLVKAVEKAKEVAKKNENK